MEEEQLTPERNLHSDLEDLKNLVHSKGWETLVELVNDAEFATKQEVLFKPLAEREGDYMKAVLAAEYEKGFAAGIRYVVSMPSVQINVLINQLDLDKEELDG